MNEELLVILLKLIDWAIEESKFPKIVWNSKVPNLVWMGLIEFKIKCLKHEALFVSNRLSLIPGPHQKFSVDTPNDKDFVFNWMDDWPQ